MAKQTINIGTTANDKSGDPLRTAFSKVNSNFTELYTLVGGTSAALQELAQDYASPMFTHGDNTGITFTYDDANNKLIASVTVLPSQTGNADKMLITNGSSVRWDVLPVELLTNLSGTAKLETGNSRFILSSGIGFELYNGTVFKEEPGYAIVSAAQARTLKLRTKNSINTVREWAFGDDGILRLPAGGDIFNSNGISVLENNATTDRLVNGSQTVILNALGELTLPLGGTIGQSAANTFLNVYRSGFFEANQLYTKVSSTLYSAGNGCTIELIGGTTWHLKYNNDTKYTSTNLTTWANVNGGLPTPISFSYGETVNVKSDGVVALQSQYATAIFAEDGTFSAPSFESLNSTGYSIKDVGVIFSNLTTDENSNSITTLMITGNVGNGTSIGTNGNAGGQWTFTPGYKIIFPDGTVQPTAYPGITNNHEGSSVIVVGQVTATRGDLSVRLTNNSNTLDVELKYSNAGGQRSISVYRAYPTPLNIYSGFTTKTAGNTTWDNVGNLSVPGNSLSFTVTDQTFHKIYRVTVIADEMPGVGIAGEAYCTIEQLQ